MENAALLSDRFEIPLAQRGFADLVLSEQDIDLLILKHETDERIAERFKKCRANPGVSLSQTIFEVLSSNRYRYGPKAYHESAQAINEGKIARAQARELPIFLTFSFFPAKAPNPLKTFGSSCAGVDMGECASLLRLYELAAILSQAYEPGVRWLVGMDGVKYHEVFGIPKPEALRYRDNIIKLAEFLGIAEYFEFVEETDLYPPEFTDHKDRNVEQILQAYQGWCECTTELINKLRKSTALSLNFRGCAIDMLADLFGNPTPDSEIRDMRENVAKQALDAAIKYQGIYRAIYDLNLYQNDKKFADAIKCTVHPKDGQIGVYPVSESVRIFPHHGQGFYKAPIGRSSATKDIRVGFAADLLRSTTGKTLQGITLNPEKYPFAEPGHPFLVRPELLH